MRGGIRYSIKIFREVIQKWGGKLGERGISLGNTVYIFLSFQIKLINLIQIFELNNYRQKETKIGKNWLFLWDN